MTRTITACLVACALALATAGLGAQSRLTLVPSASISSLFDTNVFARADASGDQMTLVTPALEATYETASKMLFGAYTFDVQRSLLHPTLNYLHSRRHGILDTQWHLSSRFTFGLGGRYDRTDSPSEFQRFTGVLLDRRRADRWEGGPSFSYRTSPRVSVSGLYNWIGEDVIGEDGVGSREEVGRFGVTGQTTARSTFGVGVLGRRFVSPDEAIVPSGLPTAVVRGDELTLHDGHQVVHGGRFSSVAPLAAWSYELASATRISVQAGPRYSTALRALMPEVAAGFGRRAPGVLGYGVDYWRGESIILGVLGPVEVNGGTARVIVPVRPYLEMGVNGGVFSSQTLSQGRVRVYHAEVGGSWITKGIYTIATAYAADFQRGDVRSSLLDDQRIVRHVIHVRVTAAPRLSKSFKPDDPLQPIGVPTKGVK